MIYGVPEINVGHELKTLCLKYGEIKRFEKVSKYEVEQFTECYHCNYKRIQSARIAKKFLDNKSFFGGILHVCYSPEYENLTETKEKIKQRVTDVQSRSDVHGPSLLDYANLQTQESVKGRKRKHPALLITEKRLKYEDTSNIWEGIPLDIDPRLQTPFHTNSTVGFKKHFQLKMPTYGPIKPDMMRIFESSVAGSSQSEIVSSEDTSRDVHSKAVKTTLVPSMVIKNFNNIESVKKIIFRNKK